MKYLNRILNFSDDNIINAQNLLISKEEAKGLIKEIQTEYIPKAIIKIRIEELKKQNEKEPKGTMRDYLDNEVIRILEELLEYNEHCICTKCTNKECVHHKCKMDCVFDAEDSYECCDGFLKKGDCSSFIENEENK